MAAKNIVKNLTQHEGWSRYDPATIKDSAAQWGSDAAYDEWEHLGAQVCEERLGGLIAAALTKRERAGLPDDAQERLCAELQESGSDKLESVFHAFLDAMTWAWEQAYTPTDQDFEKAVEKAKEEWTDDLNEGDHWEFIQNAAPQDPHHWSPHEGKWDPKDIWRELTGLIEYRHKAREYDRYLVFGFPNARSVRELKEALRKAPRKAGDEPVALPEYVDEDLARWSDHFEHLTFRKLEEIMEDVDPANRYDLDPLWKSVLKDKSLMMGVRRDILQFFGLGGS